MSRRVHTRTYPSPETPKCEVPNNGVIEISLITACLYCMVTLRFRLGRVTENPLAHCNAR